MSTFRYPNLVSSGFSTFSSIHKLPDAVSLDFTEVNPLYAADHCHINAKDAAKFKGKRVHGWALWEFYGPDFPTPVIVGNFHSVWENEEGELIDVTPPKTGTKTLFVRDDSLSIKRITGSHELPFDRTNAPAALYIYPLTGQRGDEGSRYKLADSAAKTAYCRALGWSDEDWS